jgi:heme-degrading monooxygenase HmoA
MFMRLLNLNAKSDDVEVLRSFYDSVIIGELQKIEGCLFAGLLQSNQDATEIVSLTLWDSRDHADAYEKSGTFKKLLDQAAFLLSGFSEWKVQLSEDLELEYSQDEDEPELEQFNVTVHERTKQKMFSKHSKMYVRIVSHILQKDKITDFRDIYMEEILPVLRETDGCQYAYLIEGMNNANEVISLTIWDSQRDAQNYEKSGLFLELVNKLRPTFSQFYQWKMTLDKNSEKKVSTSDDLKVSDYQVVTGRNLRKSFPEHR